MREFRHRGCKSVLFRYLGPPLRMGSTKSSSEWQFSDGAHPREGSSDMAQCDDCGAEIFPSYRTLEPLDERPFFEGDFEDETPKPAEQKPTLLSRLRAIFHF